MPITRTPIVNDNGTGTTGTIIDNAWKQELYGQIDAADVAAVASGPSILGKQNGGPNTATGYTLLGTVTLPPLGINDCIKVVVTLVQLTAAGGPLYLATAAAQLIRLDDIGTGGALAAGAAGMWEVTLHEPMVNPAQAQAVAWGGTNGAAAAIRTGVYPLGGSVNWNSGFPLYLVSASQAAGGTQYWAWTVWKI